jgi:hypothetical protein
VSANSFDNSLYRLGVIRLILYDVLSVLVHNQCSDFELISPAYFGSDIIWHIPPDQKVDANTMTRASFGKNAIKGEFASVLTYKLQRKGSLESNADNTLTNHRLLVIWRSDNRYDFSVRVLLIKHDNTITLGKDKLEKLDYSSLDPLRDDCIIKNTWVLNDATVLMTTSKWEKQIRKIKIIISKGTKKDNDSMAPLRISSNM